MPKLLALVLLAGALYAQPPAPEPKDPLGRNTPQDSIFHFLEACHARDYSRAAHYLDLRHMSVSERAKAGPELARQLEDLLDDTTFDIATLSRDPEGDRSDGLRPTLERLDTVHVGGQTLNLQLERVEFKNGLHVWLVSEESLPLIPTAHQIVAETAFEKHLPQQLVTTELLATPVWRWIALLLMGVALWFLSKAVAWAIVKPAGSIAGASSSRGPLRLCLAAAGFWGALELAPPSSIPRLFLQRLIELIFFLALASAGAVIVDIIAERWSSRLNPRVQAMSYSVLPLGRQVLKLSIYLLALLSVFSAWGYNTSTILAGLGVGGLAVALAAQKTIENLFGGISVIGDRPVLVGDVCRFGDRVGTVMHIGLRSTRIRTPDRTVISVPNGQFSSMALENISGRDKIWFHPTLNLRRDTTSEQLQEVLTAVRKILAGEPKVEAGNIPVRFVGIGTYSLDVEVDVCVATRDYDEFLALQQNLLLQLLQAVERSGAALAVPIQESFESRHKTN
jgi:MscS family membrane protein